MSHYDNAVRLAIAHGCDPINDCWRECVEAAEWTLDNLDDQSDTDRAWIEAVLGRAALAGSADDTREGTT